MKRAQSWSRRGQTRPWQSWIRKRVLWRYENQRLHSIDEGHMARRRTAM